MQTTFYPISFSHENCGEVVLVKLFLSPTGEMVAVGACDGCGKSIDSPFTVAQMIEQHCSEGSSAEKGENLADMKPANKVAC